MGAAAPACELGDPASDDEDHVSFSPIEEEFFETAQERTDNDDQAYLHEPLGGRLTETVQAVAGRSSRCYAVFR